MTADPDPDAGRMDRELLDFVTHEVGNQLTVINGFAELLADAIDELPVDMAREFAGAILRNGEQMRAVLQSVTDLRRLDAGGQLDVRPQQVDLVAVVQRAVDGWGGDLAPRRVDLDLPAELVTTADPARVGQIVSALLSNVVRHATGSTCVAVELAPAGGDVEVAVTDDGAGVAPERAGALFERSTEPGTKLKGAGLGLTLARHAARAQGGDLVLVEHPQGARFVLRLPYLPG